MKSLRNVLLQFDCFFLSQLFQRIRGFGLSFVSNGSP